MIRRLLSIGFLVGLGGLQEVWDYTWRFQFWFRDPAAGGSGFNLNDALRVTFGP